MERKSIMQHIEEQKQEITDLKQENLLLKTEIQTVKDLFLQYINQNNQQ